VIDGFLAAWEQVAAGGPAPVVADALAALPEADRPHLRPVFAGLDEWARAALVGGVDTVSVIVATGPEAAAPETVDFAPSDPAPLGSSGSDATPRASGGAESDAAPKASGVDTTDLTSGHVPSSVASDHAPSADFDPDSPAPRPPAKAARPRGIGHLPGYEILGELGRGGMGVVYRARHLKLNRLVAVKLLLNAEHAGTTARERFDAEARAVAQMQHPNIVQVFEVGEVDGAPFFSLEYVPGGSLADRVAQNLLPVRETADLMVTLARAMQYAHEHGIIHRDLKPANVLLTDGGAAGSQGGSGSTHPSSASRVRHPLTPKITDFGLAKKVEEDSGLTRAGAVMGTPSYMPPEQASGQPERVGPLADVYALGAILYDLLTGRPPFKGANVLDTLAQVRTQEPLAPSSLQPGVPKDLETICLKCLQKDPVKRYQSAAALADDLQRYVNGEPIQARPIGSTERAWRWCKRNPRVAGLLATVGGLLLLIAAGSSGAAVVINGQKSEIAQKRDELEAKNDTIAGQLAVITAQRDELKGKNETIAGQLVEIRAKTALAEKRYAARQSAIDTFVNEAPGLLEGNPLAVGPNAELLALTTKLMEESEGEAEDRALTDRGRMAVLFQRAEAARARAMAGTGGVIDGKALDEADRLYEDAQKLAESLDRPGSPERDKAAGNRALMLVRQATIRQLRGLAAPDPNTARQHLTEAIRLDHEALRVQQRVLDAPESGEIPPGEVRAWLGGTHVALAEAHHFRARVAATPDDARPDLLAERDHARQAEEHLGVGIASGSLAPRVKARMTYQLAYAALEAGRAADRLDELDAADTAYKRAADRFVKLVAEVPTNLMYRNQLAVVSAEYGDFLLMRRKDAARAKAMYTLSVIHLRPIAQPQEIDRPLRNLALNYYRVATATLKTGDRPNALRLYGLSLEIREAQLRDAERLAASRKEKDPPYLIRAKIPVMLLQARLGKYKEAAAFAQELAEKFPGNGQWLFQAACGFALSAAAVPDTEPELKEQYLRRSVECLNRAIDNGYDDLAALERDPDLDPVRDAGRLSGPDGPIERLKLLRGKK
jgi:serine/threonine protein kinase